MLVPVWMEAGYQIVVTADHGMNENHLHGGNSELQRTVPLYIISDKVIKEDHTSQIFSQLYVTSIICKLLGIEPSPGMKSLSKMQEDIFKV
jgi:phosphoglycerol transferase MdoB-like AlkP superfamily enzyme